MPELFEDKSEKKVEYIELIYDLIFVYLVSRNGDLLHTIEGGFIRPMAFFSYTASTLIILQVWYYSTVLINRYGRGKLAEFVGIFINMYLLYYMADGIRDDWGVTYTRYHLAWALILVNLAVQYLILLRRGDWADGAERRHMRYQLSLLLAQAAVALVSIPIYHRTGAALGPRAMVLGFAATLLCRRTEDAAPLDFGHLSERVMLYIVFTFGEMILGIAGYFASDFDGWTMYYSLMAFLIVAGLFSSYGTFYNSLLDRERTGVSGGGYMLLHIVMILALNNITAAMEFMRVSEIAAVPKNLFMVASLLVYYLCLLLTQPYARTRAAGGRRFYRKVAANFGVYGVLMAVFYRSAPVSIALTMVFIGFQLYALRRGGRDRPDLPEE